MKKYGENAKNEEGRKRLRKNKNTMKRMAMR